MGEAQRAGGREPAAAGAATRRFRWASPLTATFAGGLVLALLVAGLPLSDLARRLTLPAHLADLLVLAVVVVAVVVARHQPANPVGWILLAGIDRIISRTLAYTIVTGLLLGVYAGLVLLATHVLGFRTPVAVAASTLAAAALFNPLRHRVQRAVDRRFNRARYDADRTVAAFAAGLKDAVDLDQVRDDLAGVVHRALEPTTSRSGSAITGDGSRSRAAAHGGQSGCYRWSDPSWAELVRN